METGIKGTCEITVTKDLLASSLGSGGVDVFATPFMIAYMEHTCLKSVEKLVGEGNTTVGTLVNVSHFAATPAGMKVRFESELKDIDRKKLVFSVCAYDEKEKIGEGMHERFIVNEEKFINKVQDKLSKD